MPNKQFSSLINQYNLQLKNCIRFHGKSTHHTSLVVLIPKNEQITDTVHVLVKCNSHERLYLLLEECIFLYDSRAKLCRKIRICGVHPVREGVFGKNISRAVTLVQNERFQG